MVTHVLSNTVEAKTRSKFRSLLAATFFLILLGACWWMIIKGEIRSANDLVESLQTYLNKLGFIAPLLGFIIATLLLVSFVSSTLVYAACGIAFGVPIGLTIATLALGSSNLIERALGYYVAGPKLRTYILKKHPKIDTTIHSAGLRGVLILRILGAPPAIMGWASSATTLSLWVVPIGCMIGTLPRGAAYVALGSSGGSLWPPSEWNGVIYTSIAMLLITGVITILMGIKNKS